MLTSTEKKILVSSVAAHFTFPKNVTKPLKIYGAHMVYQEMYLKYAQPQTELFVTIGINSSKLDAK